MIGLSMKKDVYEIQINELVAIEIWPLTPAGKEGRR
jgi:hypothetical protein